MTDDDLIGRYGYWDLIEAALTSLPEDNKLRALALASFDHLKERITGQHDQVVERIRQIPPRP